MTTHSSWLCIAIGLVVIASGAGASKDRAAELHGGGVALHLERRLGEASALYGEALALGTSGPAVRRADGTAWNPTYRATAPEICITMTTNI